MRRPYRVKCVDQGCQEHGLFEFDSARERDEAILRWQERPWRCVRHTNPEENLSPNNPIRTVVLTARRDPGLSRPLLFWTREDGTQTSGFRFGPGFFKADADDFPEGTRLTVSASVVLPPGSVEVTHRCAEKGCETPAIWRDADNCEWCDTHRHILVARISAEDVGGMCVGWCDVRVKSQSQVEG